MEKALLVGNGVNQLLGHQGSWFDVLRDLAASIGHPELMESAEHKPFSLIYEEIALLSEARAKDDELTIKKRVAERINQIPHNHYHQRLVETVPRHIITTNYDYNLERASGLETDKANLRGEPKYNVFRRRRVGDKFIWHIHGEAEVPNSITLGHEQYAGQLQKLRSYVTANRNSKSRLKSPFKLRNLTFDNPKNDRPYSWVDVFFRDEIHIVGVSLDYTEIDLWWVLAYKRRLQQMSAYTVGGTIYYSIKPEDSQDPAKAQEARAKLSILQSFGVTIEHCAQNSYSALYDRVLAAMTA